MDNNNQTFRQPEVIQPLQVEMPCQSKAVSLYVQQAYNHFSQGDVEGAIADFNIALCIHPNSAELYTARGNFRKQKLGDRLGAIEDYTQAIFINPDNAFFYFCRSQTYQELGNQQKAIEDYNTGLTLAPEGTMCCVI